MSRSPSPNAGPAGKAICSICGKGFSSAMIRDLHLPICRKKQQGAFELYHGDQPHELNHPRARVYRGYIIRLQHGRMGN